MHPQTERNHELGQAVHEQLNEQVFRSIRAIQSELAFLSRRIEEMEDRMEDPHPKRQGDTVHDDHQQLSSVRVNSRNPIQTAKKIRLEEPANANAAGSSHLSGANRVTLSGNNRWNHQPTKDSRPAGKYQ